MPIFTVAGLLLNLIGVLLLFRYGMPYRVRTGGADYIQTRQTDQEAIKAERRYNIWGNIGLAFLILGTIAQIMGIE
jgi:hypothetical protein